VPPGSGVDADQLKRVSSRAQDALEVGVGEGAVPVEPVPDGDSVGEPRVERAVDSHTSSASANRTSSGERDVLPRRSRAPARRRRGRPRRRPAGRYSISRKTTRRWEAKTRYERSVYSRAPSARAATGRSWRRRRPTAARSRPSADDDPPRRGADVRWFAVPRWRREVRRAVVCSRPRSRLVAAACRGPGGAAGAPPAPGSAVGGGLPALAPGRRPLGVARRSGAAGRRQDAQHHSRRLVPRRRPALAPLLGAVSLLGCCPQDPAASGCGVRRTARKPPSCAASRVTQTSQ